VESWKLQLGATVSGEGTRFRAWAPRVSKIHLEIRDRGVFPMEAEEKGYYTAWVQGLRPGARYSYLLEENRRRPDPASRFQPDGVNGPSEVVDPGAFAWEDGSWKGIAPEELILYELHTGTFTPEGTFEAIIPRIAYLKGELGVTALEIMPVAQFPGSRNWGYDGAYPYAPQNSYGGPRRFKELINACHGKGLAVILDVVYNHLGPEGNYLSEFGPYFQNRCQTPWGSAVNFDGPESDEVRRFFIENALYWATEYHVDGLRLDAVHGMFDFSAHHFLAELRERIQEQSDRLGRRVITIAESDLNDVRVLNSPERGGYGLDAQFNDDFHHSLHVLLTGERNSYYQDFGDLGQLARALQDGYVYTGQYSSSRKRRHGSPSGHLSPFKFIDFCQNHDQVGNRLKGLRLSKLVSFEALKLAAGLVVLTPHIPLLFMGEEYGEEAPFTYFIHHSNPALVEAVRKGRREEFAEFQREGEPPDPQSEAVFRDCKIDPDLRLRGNHKKLFEYYKTLIRYRKKNPALFQAGKEGLKIDAPGENLTLSITRGPEGGRVFCLAYFGQFPGEVRISAEPGRWKKILDSSSPEWGGPGVSAADSISGDGGKLSLRLGAYNFLVYQKIAEKSPFVSI
jgi:maltooligosyltrehalose trehalohydrolase